MDRGLFESRFDVLAKVVAGATAGVSRREALRRLGGAAAGAALAYFGIGCADEAVGPSGDATRPVLAVGGCKANGRKCRPNSKCCSGVCDEVTHTCVCPSGTTDCGGTCVNLSTDANNCGACGSPCTGGTCVSGGCVCPSGTINCGGTCVNVNSNASHCGSCDNACQFGVCCAGFCCAFGETCTFVTPEEGGPGGFFDCVG